MILCIGLRRIIVAKGSLALNVLGPGCAFKIGLSVLGASNFLPLILNRFLGVIESLFVSFLQILVFFLSRGGSRVLSSMVVVLGFFSICMIIIKFDWVDRSDGVHAFQELAVHAEIKSFVRLFALVFVSESRLHLLVVGPFSKISYIIGRILINLLVGWWGLPDVDLGLWSQTVC